MTSIVSPGWGGVSNERAGRQPCSRPPNSTKTSSRRKATTRPRCRDSGSKTPSWPLPSPPDIRSSSDRPPMARSNSASMVAVSFCRRPGITGVSSSCGGRRTRLTGSGNERLRRRKRLARHRQRIEVGQIGAGQSGGTGPQGFILGVRRRAPRQQALAAAAMRSRDRSRPVGRMRRQPAVGAAACGVRAALAAIACGGAAGALVLHVAWLHSLLLCGLAPAGRDDRGRRDVAGDVPLRHPE